MEDVIKKGPSTSMLERTGLKVRERHGKDAKFFIVYSDESLDSTLTELTQWMEADHEVLESRSETMSVYDSFNDHYRGIIIYKDLEE